MPRVRQLKTNFVAGEFDPRLLARSDVKHYYNAASLVRNAIVVPQGGVGIRPGSRYVWTVPPLPDGTPSNVRLVPFQFNTEQTYLIVLHHLTATIMRDGVVVATVGMPYTSDDLVARLTPGGDLIASGVNWTQSKDTLILFHERHPIRRLQRGASHASWTLSEFAVRNVPRYDFGENYTAPGERGVDELHSLSFPLPGDQGNWTENDVFTLLVEDEETKNIRYSSNRPALRERIEGALRNLPNTSANGVVVTMAAQDFTVEFTGPDGQRPWGTIGYNVVSAKQIPSIETSIARDGQRPGEVVWSARRGYPRCGVFFQGRLWMAGTTDLPHWVWASRVGAVDDFNSRLFSEDYGIAVQADTDDVPAILQMFAGRHLQLFATSGEFYVPVSDTDAVTPGNVALRRTTSRGIRAGTRVHDVEGATHFLQRGGGSLREMLFADTEQAYQTNNVSLLSSHLVRDPVCIGLRRSSGPNDADYEFIVNGDGTMGVFCTLRLQEVNAMALWLTRGHYRQVGVVLNEVFFAVEREVAGERVLMIERMDEGMTVDCGASGGEGEAGASLPHLPGQEVEIIHDGFAHAPALASDPGGDVTFTRPTDRDWQAGLRYGEPHPDHADLVWVAKTLPLEFDLPDGATFGRKRRVVNVTARLYETSALTVNGNRVAFRQHGANLLDAPVEPFTGIKDVRGFLGWDYEGMVVVGSDASLPATVLGLSFAVSI